MRGQYLDTLTSGSCNTGNGLFSKEVLAMRNFFWEKYKVVTSLENRSINHN